MDILGKIAKVAIDVAPLPVSVAAGVMTLGGALNDSDEPYTMSKGRRVVQETVDLVDKAAS